LPNIDYLITSRDIPTRLTGKEDLRCSLPEVQRRYGARLAAATLGSDKFHYAPAYRVQVVDTTGAGDIFHAGFIYGLVRSWPIQQQLEFACAAAALNCAAVGARGGIRRLEEIEELRVEGERHTAPFEMARSR
jgi:sulfofructose kinase